MNSIPSAFKRNIIETLRKYRDPRYTGENRCAPCTLVNLVLISGISIVSGILSPVVGTTIAATSLLVLYLRGYVVPKTPVLTKRYLPDPLLRVLGKSHEWEVNDEFDVEEPLLKLGIARQKGDEVELGSKFEQKLIRMYHENGPNILTSAENILERSGVEIQERDQVQILDGEEIVGQWPSRLALHLDLATIKCLNEYVVDWDSYPSDIQNSIVASIRTLLTECPECDSPLIFQDTEVETCCTTVDVTVYKCTTCNSELIKMPKQM